MTDDITRNIFLAFVRVHILYHADEGEVYGTEMIEELAHHGYSIGPGTIYPILHGMEKAGILSCEGRTVGGKVRKYYRCTEAGRKTLAEVQIKIRELIGEVME